MLSWTEIAAHLGAFDAGHVLAGAIGGVVGSWLAHRAALRRDRRKEFNDIARPLYAALGNQIDSLQHAAWQRDTVAVSADLLLTTCPPWRRRSIRKAAEQYKAACNLPRHAGYNTATGAVSEHPGARAAVLAAAEKLRKAVHPL